MYVMARVSYRPRGMKLVAWARKLWLEDDTALALVLSCLGLSCRVAQPAARDECDSTRRHAIDRIAAGETESTSVLELGVEA